MPFTIQDKGEAVNDVMSIFWQEYIDALIEAIGGKNLVLSGFGATSNSNMTYAIAKGAVLTNGVLKAVAANATVTITAADGTNPRLDLIVVDSSGAFQVRTGTPAAAPKPPARSANDVLLYCVYVPAGDTNLAANQLVDLRLQKDIGPITIFKTSTAELTNTTSSQINAINKPNSGLVIPNGLLSAGRHLRVRAGGNMLLNSGTPTVRIEIIYGGTTMFSSISGAATADTDRIAWHADFTISAQSFTDQALTGFIRTQILGAKTPPTSGIGPLWAATDLGGPIGGAASVDGDAGNRTLQMMFTFSVNNVANELVTEYCTVELI